MDDLEVPLLRKSIASTPGIVLMLVKEVSIIRNII